MPLYPPPSSGSGSVATDTIWNARGDLAGGTGSDTAARLAVGSDTQVLTADSGEATGLKWAASGAGSGALVPLEQHTASASATLDFTTFISSTYDDYVVELVELALATNAQDLYVRIGTGGGPTYDTGNNYEWAFAGRTTGGAAFTDEGSTGSARIIKSASNNAGYGIANGTFRLQGLQSTSHRKTLQGTIQYVDSGPAAVYAMGGLQWTTTATAVTAVRFLASSGNIGSGTIRIYGLTK